MARLSRSAEGEKDDEAEANVDLARACIRGCWRLCGERRSTLIFVNARRIAERMAGAINDLAGEPSARAHHGSLAAAQRKEIEELLKAGEIKALVATSSLELGIDMGAIDLVIQIEAPTCSRSRAGCSALGAAGQRGRRGVARNFVSKYRSDLVACAAVTQAMHEGHVESTRFLRNPLDVLAQQIVAIVAHPPMSVVEVERSTRASSEDDSGPGIGYDALFEPSCAAPHHLQG